MPTSNWKYGWSDSVSEGGKDREREGEEERENTHASSQKKTDNSVFFPPLIMVEMHFEVRLLNAAYHILCLSSIILLMKLG